MRAARIGIVHDLWRYPVKSMAGERLEGCRMAPGLGVDGDRGWALRDEAAGEIRGAKKIPELLQFAARYLEEPAGEAVPHVEIALPDGRTVQSDAPRASALVSEVLGRQVTLWPRQPAEDVAHYRRAEKITDVEAEIREVCGLLPDEPLPDLDDIPPELLELVSPPGTYFDGFELHLITSASLEALAGWLPDSRIDVRRFRPNVVVQTGAGLSGLPEVEWCGRVLRIGGVRARVAIPTMRCAMVTREQADLPRDPKIMRTLVREAHQNLGIALQVIEPGEVAPGDPVELC